MKKIKLPKDEFEWLTWIGIGAASIVCVAQLLNIALIIYCMIVENCK